MSSEFVRSPFGIENPGLAFEEVLFLWLVIAATMVTLWQRSSIAGIFSMADTRLDRQQNDYEKCQRYNIKETTPRFIWEYRPYAQGIRIHEFSSAERSSGLVFRSSVGMDCLQLPESQLLSA
jgi:hypothetical protein